MARGKVDLSSQEKEEFVAFIEEHRLLGINEVGLERMKDAKTEEALLKAMREVILKKSEYCEQACSLGEWRGGIYLLPEYLLALCFSHSLRSQ